MYLDILAYFIMYLFVFYAGGPAFFSGSNTKYLDAVKISLAIQVFIVVVGLFSFIMMWSLSRIAS